MTDKKARAPAEKRKLNKIVLPQLEAKEGKQTLYWDTDQPGFGVRVSNGRLVDGVREYSYTFFCQGWLRGKLIKKTIGKHPTVSPESARKKARAYIGQISSGIDPRIEKDNTKAATFGDMMLGYTEWMESAGKLSARKVKQEIEKSIQKPFRGLWNKPANKITIDDCDRIIARLEDANTPRQADKIRSYMKAAFTKAINSRRNRKMPQGLKLADVKHNPCNDIEKVSGSSKSTGRALSLAESRAFWQRVKELPEPGRSLMMLFVLTGGQRERQLSRVTLNDIDRDAPSITLADYKGRRTSAYAHTVPLVPDALQCVDRLTGAGEFVFSCNGGISPICDAYIGKRVAAIKAAMAEAGELEKGHFTPKTIRKTVESQLAAPPYRVSSDVLAHLESHGRGTVQAKHYQRHSYFEEKLEALQMLQRMVEGKPEPSAQILPFNREASA